MSAPGGSTKVIVFALLANLGIALAKFFGAWISKSTSMLAEAIHSLVDTSNQALLLIGSSQAKKPPSETHPLGYGREAFFWSFIVAILLFSLGGLFAIYEGAHKLSSLEEMSSPGLALGILVVSLVLEGFSFWACLKEVQRQNTESSLWRWFRRTTSAELLVVLTEDAAAMLGLLIATASLLIAWITGNPVWDAIGSISVGSVLIIVAVFLAIEIKSLLVGEAPSKNYRPFLEKEVSKRISGGKLLRLIALQTGADEVLLSLKIHPGEIRDVSVLIASINALEEEIRRAFPEVKWQFIESDFVE